MVCSGRALGYEKCGSFPSKPPQETWEDESRRRQRRRRVLGTRLRRVAASGTCAHINMTRTVTQIQKLFLSSPRYAVVGASKDQSKYGTKVRRIIYEPVAICLFQLRFFSGIWHAICRSSPCILFGFHHHHLICELYLLACCIAV